MKNVIYLCFLALLATSCSEEQLLNETVPDYSLNLNFEDSDEMINYFNSTINGGDNASQRTSIQVDSEFESFKEVYFKVSTKLNEAQTIEQHNFILSKYSDIIKLEDSMYVPKITDPFYQAVCNKDGIYESGGYAHKVIDNKNMVITESENIKALQKVNSISGLDPEVFRVAAYNATSQSDQGRAMANCGDNVIQSYFNNNSKCRDDRKVWARGFTSFIISGYYYTPRAIAEIYGTFRNGWCNWNTYETRLQSRDCSYTVTATLNGQNYSIIKSFPDDSGTEDRYNIVLSEGAIGGAIYWQGGAVPTIQFTQVNLEGTSRGVNGNWVELNCQ